MKETLAERDALLRPDTKIIDPEPERLHSIGIHAKFYKQFPGDVHFKGQRFRNKPLPRRVDNKDLETI